MRSTACTLANHVSADWYAFLLLLLLLPTRLQAVRGRG
jgi:hypothetical protein